MNKLLLRFLRHIILLPVLFMGALSAQDDIDNLNAQLKKILPPNITDVTVTHSETKNVYQVQIEDRYMFAYWQEGKLLLGDLFSIEGDTVTSISQKIREKELVNKVKLLDNVPLQDMIVFGKDNAKRHITVFTDIDCGYCRKLHREIDEIVKSDIQVRYMPFPRAGIDSESYQKFVNVWCSEDKNEALTKAKAGEVIAKASCENPVKKSYELGQKIGIQGTPTIILDDGRVLPGYVPHEELKKTLENTAG